MWLILVSLERRIDRFYNNGPIMKHVEYIRWDIYSHTFVEFWSSTCQTFLVVWASLVIGEVIRASSTIVCSKFHGTVDGVPRERLHDWKSTNKNCTNVYLLVPCHLTVIGCHLTENYLNTSRYKLTSEEWSLKTINHSS